MPFVTVSIQSNEIKVYRGDSQTIRCTVKYHSSESAVNITGYTPKLTIKRNAYDEDADALLIKTGTLSNPTAGECQFALTYENTTLEPGVYYYDVQLVNGNTVKTVAKDKFIVSWDVIRASVV